jgi:hypothetical protein
MAKKGPRVMLPLWFPTTKNRELPWFPCVQVACHIPLENSQRRLQLCCRPHFNRRSTHKVVGFPISRISRLQLGSPGTKWHLGADPWLGTDNTKSLGHGESCDSVFAHGSFVHQKCCNYALINLLFGLCKFVWVIDYLSHFLVPIPELRHAPLHQSVAN